MAATKRPGKERRAQILSHAAQLFHSQGYHATTMDDVADSVSLNKGTLYYYYESKTNLLFEILLNTSERRLVTMRGMTQQLEPAEAVRAYIEDTIDYLTEHPIEASVSFQEAPFLHHWLSRDQVSVIQARYAAFENHAFDAVGAGQKAGLFDPDLDPRVIAHALTAIVSWFVRWYKPGGRLSSQKVAEQSSRLVLRGLLTPEGHQQIDAWPSANTDAKPAKRRKQVSA